MKRGRTAGPAKRIGNDDKSEQIRRSRQHNHTREEQSREEKRVGGWVGGWVGDGSGEAELRAFSISQPL
jgi:hypothetical protein